MKHIPHPVIDHVPMADNLAGAPTEILPSETLVTLRREIGVLPREK